MSPPSVTGLGVCQSVDQRVQSLERGVVAVATALGNDRERLRAEVAEQVADAATAVARQAHQQDAELRTHLRHVLVGSVRERVAGTVLLVAGIVLSVAANVVGALS